MKIQGIFTIEVIEVSTGEVVRRIDSMNAITNWGHTRNTLFQRWNTGGGFSPFGLTDSIILSPDVVNPKTRHHVTRSSSEFNLGDVTDITDFVTVATGLPLRIEYIPSAGIVPAAYQVFGQFDPPPPGPSRTINHVAVGQSVNRTVAYTDLSAAPCIQTDTQQLNVTYRVQFFDEPVPIITDIWRNPETVEYWAQAHALVQSDGGNPPAAIPDAPFDRAIPEYFSKTFLPHIANQNTYTDLASMRQNNLTETASGEDGFVNLPTSNVKERDERQTGNVEKHTWDWNNSISDSIGRIFGTAVIGWRENVNVGIRPHEILQTPWAPDVFPNQPVQTLHNHNSNATQPFLDTNFLATGQGSITLNGTGWNSKGRIPEYYRIEATNTGQVGTSRYHFQVRHMVGGLQGDNAQSLEKWRGVREPIVWFSSFNPTFWPGVTWTRDGNTASGGNFFDQTHNFEEYNDNEHIVVWVDDLGIAVLNIFDGNAVVFDPTTTPALSVTAIYDVTVSDNGTIWVADAGNGLFRIVDPLGTPIITKMTNATHGIPAGTENCFGVCQGFGDSIWAMFDGGLSKTINGGVSWINHDPGSVPAFAYILNTGITNNNWDLVRGIQVDRESPDNEMLIQHHDPSANITEGRASYAWWSEAGVSYEGPDNNQSGQHLKSPGGISMHLFACSRRGSFFCANVSPSGTWGTQTIYRYDFGHNTFRSLQNIAITPGESGGSQFLTAIGRVPFFYDQYGEPHVVADAIGGGFSNTREKVGNRFANLTDVVGGNAASHNTSFSFQGFNGADQGFHSGWAIKPFTGATPALDRFMWEDMYDFLDPGPLNLNEQRIDDTLLQDIMWKDYRWNGTNWIKDFHTPAIDLSGNGFNGIRKGFRIEDLTFRGRSTIDASAGAGNFGTGAITFVATVSPLSKSLSEQFHQEALFSWSNGLSGSAKNEFTMYWDGVKHTSAGTPTPQVSIQSFTQGPTGSPLLDNTATVIGTTPADGGTFRVVFVVNGTNVNVFIDGIQLGVTTVEPGLSTSAVNTAQMIIGSRTFFSQFFHGDMTNIQIWNFPWAVGDAIADTGNPTGVNVPTGGALANLICHYDNTASIAGLESKTTHVAQEALNSGLTIGFANGASAPAFVDTDYYTVGVCDGILKDNAISYDYHQEIYTTPVTYDFPDIEDTVNAPAGPQTSVVIPVTGGQITEIPVWRKYDEAATARYAYLSSHGELGFIANGDFNISTFQQITGNGYIEWTMPSTFTGDQLTPALSEVPDNDSLNPGYTYAIRFRQFGAIGSVSDRAFEVVELNTTTFALAGPQQWLPGDVFRIQKVGSTVTFLRNGGIFFTSARPSVAPVWGRCQMFDELSTTINWKINYTRPAGWIDLGNTVTATGKYNPDHMNIDEIGIAGTINAAPFTSIKTDLLLRIEEIGSSPQAPGVGEVLVIPDAGMALFNPADFGKTATMTYIHVRFI